MKFTNHSNNSLVGNGLWDGDTLIKSSQLAGIVEKAKTQSLTFFSRIKRRARRGGLESHQTTNFFSRFPGRKMMKLLFIILALFFAVYASRSLASNFRDRDETKESLQKAKVSKEINREFNFPLLDDEGEEVANIKYEILKAELLDEIIIKGQKARAIKGRTFLIITLKIVNDFDRSIEIDTRDYIRVALKKNEEEWLAPEIHNDPVEVQALSTKYTRVGFPIDDFEREVILRVGEIKGDKEKFQLDLN